MYLVVIIHAAVCSDCACNGDRREQVVKLFVALHLVLFDTHISMQVASAYNSSGKCPHVFSGAHLCRSKVVSKVSILVVSFGALIYASLQ